MLSKKIRGTLMLALSIFAIANILPAATISTAAYAKSGTSDSEDIGDKKKFSKAKEKALEFISNYNFTKDKGTSGFSKAFINALKDYGITGGGLDNTSIDYDSGVISGDVALNMDEDEYTFPFTAHLSGADYNDNLKKDRLEKAKEKTLKFIPTYNFTSKMLWDDFGAALLKELTGSETPSGDSESGVTGVGETTNIDKNTGIITGTINLHIKGYEEDCIIPFTAQASDIKNSSGISPSWNKNADGSWSLIINGQSVTGWHQVAGKWYHLNQKGIMEAGWLKDTDGNWYFLKSSGEMAMNEYINGYYVNNSGVWVK